MYMFSGFFIAIYAVLALGWIIPFTVGVRRLNRSAGGTGLTIFGGIWAALGLGLLALAGIAGFLFHSVRSHRSAPEDFDPSTYEGETGAIVLSYRGPSSLAIEDRETQKDLRLSTTNGVMVAPLGKYKLGVYRATKRDGDGKEWQAHTYFGSRRGAEIEVGGDVPLPLTVGPPFTARAKSSKRAHPNVRLDFQLTDAGGAKYSIYSPAGRPPAPKFEITDVTGKRVLSGKFEYG